MPEITLSIIGTAGRRDDGKKLSATSFKAMYSIAEELLKQLGENNYPITHLVSGGSAWADHVAVKLFLNKKAAHLRLFLPCNFENGTFSEEYSRITFPPTKENINRGHSPSQTLNYLHSLFQRATNINSLTEIQCAFNEGAELLPCRGGFHGRNAMVAKSDIILAMTFGVGDMVKEGGTADTVRKYLERVRKEHFFNKSFHYNLADGKIYMGITAPPDPREKK